MRTQGLRIRHVDNAVVFVAIAHHAPFFCLLRPYDCILKSLARHSPPHPALPTWGFGCRPTGPVALLLFLRLRTISRCPSLSYPLVVCSYVSHAFGAPTPSRAHAHVHAHPHGIPAARCPGLDVHVQGRVHAPRARVLQQVKSS